MFVIIFIVPLLVTASTKENASCDEPPLIERTVLPKNFRDVHPVGSVVEYNCDFGYSPSQYRKSITCQYVEETGKAEWTKLEFACIPRSCGDPGFVSHARKNGSVFTYPNSVTYICDVGYKIAGIATRFCQTNGQWSSKLPSCNSVSCAVPDDIDNGSVKYDNLEYGAELEYGCNKGFSLSTTEKRSCSDNGLWSGHTPKCLENYCPMPEPPLHGSMEIVGNKTNFGSIVIYTCNEGFRLVGSETSKCISVGVWKTAPPICLESCKVPDVENGKIGVYTGRSRWRTFQAFSAGENIEHVTNLFLKCKDQSYEAVGYDLSEIPISCSDGIWNSEPACKPVPECLSPPPSVPNAKLMTTERKSGTSLYFKCNEGFVKTTIGSNTCIRGQWVGKLPVCSDTRCSVSSLNYAGLNKNGRDKYSNTEIFKPQCSKGYEISYPNNLRLVCHSGQWIGNFPPCKPVSCSRITLDYLGLKQNGKEKYSDTEIFNPECLEGYEIANPTNPRLVCSFGEWKGHLPPCKPVSCSRITLDYLGLKQNGKEKYSDREIFNPECLEGYEITNPMNPRLVCSFGEWKGHLPPCKPVVNYCYLKNFLHKDGVNTSDPSPTSSGDYLKVSCLEGFEKKVVNLLCKNGKWEYQLNLSPCQPSSCIVGEVPNGSITYRQLSKQSYIYRKESTGTKYSHDSHIYLFCNKPYIFNGAENKTIITLKCAFGKWDPLPLCLLPTSSASEDYIISSSTEDSLTSISASKVTSPMMEGSAIEMTSSTQLSTFGQNSSEVKLETYTSGKDTSFQTHFLVNETSTEPVEQSCTCIYNLQEEDIIAYSDSEMLRPGSQVKQGYSVHFFCKELGIDRLIGNPDLKCENCVWHLLQFPYCVKPKNGDAIIYFETIFPLHFDVNPFGVIIVPSDISLNITCKADNWSQFLNLSHLGRHYHTTFSGRKREYVTRISISRTSSFHNGRYECKPTSGHSNYLDISVLENFCPDIVITGSITVHYSNGNKPGSKAVFRCLDETETLNGNPEITCLSTGRWSDGFPTCVYVLCPAFNLQENLIVNYRGDRRVNSLVEFYCRMPYILKGNQTSTCLSSGYWSEIAPICEYTSCPMHLLMDKLQAIPEGVAPKLEDVTAADIPYGSVLRLECTQKSHLTRGEKNATCTETGEWLIGKVSCIYGCEPVAKSVNDALIVDPNKEFYVFGEHVTFQCPPGFSLSVKIERMMCLGHGWSAEVIPTCK